MNDYKPLERQRLEELYRKQNVRINELEQENKRLKEAFEIADMCVNNTVKENRKLKEDNRFLTKISKEYMEKENIIEVTEFTELYKDDLEKENKSLKAEIELLKKPHFSDRYLKELEEENNKLKLHIEAKDKAYTALLKDYEELKEDRKKILDEIDAEIERFKDFRKSLEK